MACLFGHKWNGCKCSKCGKTRDEGHIWNGCTCATCGKTQDNGHKYVKAAGCKAVCSICGHTTDSVYHNWVDGKCSDCGKTRGRDEQNRMGSASPPSNAQSPQKAGWTPTNARLSSNMPISSLLRIFIFTNGDGKTVLNCPVAMGTLADTAGAPLTEVIGKVPFDIIARSNLASQIILTGQFPAEGWMAMRNIDATATEKAQNGEYRSVVRPVTNPKTGESSCCVLIYQKSGNIEQPQKHNAAPEKAPETNKDFTIVIDDVVSKQGRGTYVIGIVRDASISMGDSAYIVKSDGNAKATKVNDIRDDVETSTGVRNNANVGDAVAILLQGIASSDVAKGDVLSAKEAPSIQAVSQSPQVNVPPAQSPAKPGGTPEKQATEEGTGTPAASQASLAETAKNDKNSDVRRSAIIKIMDQKLLADIAINACAESNNIGMDTMVAYKKVKDLRILAEVAQKAKDWSVRGSCCKRLEDVEVLEKIAREDSSELVRQAANSKARIISERKPADHVPSFESLFFQISLLARGETPGTGGLSSSYSYEKMSICDRFISYGKDAAQALKSYLMTCAAGKEQYGWWTNASLIVECIPLAAGDSEADKLILMAWLSQLVNVPSNIYEYDNDVRRYAQVELDALTY